MIDVICSRCRKYCWMKRLYQVHRGSPQYSCDIWVDALQTFHSKGCAEAGRAAGNPRDELPVTASSNKIFCSNDRTKTSHHVFPNYQYSLQKGRFSFPRVDIIRCGPLKEKPSHCRAIVGEHHSDAWTGEQRYRNEAYSTNFFSFSSSSRKKR